MAGSLAVATDAAHLLTDFAGFMISLFALYIAERPATKRLSYGYHRAGHLFFHVNLSLFFPSLPSKKRSLEFTIWSFSFFPSGHSHKFSLKNGVK